MYKDLLDLRSNNWVPRRKVEKAKTLEEIRKDVEREERLQAQQSQQNNYRGGGRRDNYGGRDSKPRNTFSTSKRSSCLLDTYTNQRHRQPTRMLYTAQQPHT
mgnify:CR=1 FL=1